VQPQSNEHRRDLYADLCARVERAKRAARWRHRLGMGLLILVSVTCLILVLTGVIPLDGTCTPGAAVVDPSCVVH